MILSEKKLFCIHFLYSQPHLIAKRASSCISKAFHITFMKKRIKGSITIETALILPFFFLAVICLFYMMEVMAIRTSIRSGMQYTARVVAEEAIFKPVVTTTELENQMVHAIGSERLDRSILLNGSGGIHCENSRMSAITGILELEVTYEIKMPVPAISNITVPMKETMRVKGWCGYSRTGFSTASDQIVYTTENGMVYHKDYRCNYLELSIQCVTSDSLETLRNKNQGIYHACELCVHGKDNVNVYVTDYGDRYHNSLSCSGLKRTIYAVPLAEAIGKGVCSKCGR